MPWSRSTAGPEASAPGQKLPATGVPSAAASRMTRPGGAGAATGWFLGAATIDPAAQARPGPATSIAAAASRRRRRPIASSLQLDVPVEIVAPAFVKVVGREAPAILLQLPAGRPVGAAVEVHMRLERGPAALLEVARRAGGGDILPGRPPALGARHDMVEGELGRRSEILAFESVAEEQVESGEGGMLARLHILPERDHRRQLEGAGRAVHLADILGDDVDP